MLAAAVFALPALLGQTRLRAPMPRRVARALLAVLGIRHEVRGRLPRHRALVVANHVSWLDVLVLLAHLPVRLVAKEQVRRWPFIGWLAASAGTVFIDRSRPRSLPGTVGQVATALREGDVVAVFPEGTTWCGVADGRFRPAMFQAAIDAAVPVMPASIRYHSADQRTTTAAAFVGDDTLAASLLRVAGVRGLRVCVWVHPALHPEPGASRAILRTAAQASLFRAGGQASHPGLPPRPATRAHPSGRGAGEGAA